MEALLSLVEPYLVPVISALLGKVLSAAEAKSPAFLQTLLRQFIASPEAQAELAKYEKLGAEELLKLATEGYAALKSMAEAFLRRHPALAVEFAKLEASPVAGEALSLTADEVKALYGLKAAGVWAKFRAWLNLPAA